MNNKEAIKNKIILDVKSKIGSWASNFVTIDVDDTENDATIGKKEILPESMIFEEGKFAKIFSISVVFVVMSIIYYNITRTVANPLAVIILLLFLVMFSTYVFYIHERVISNSKIVLDFNGIFFSEAGYYEWKSIKTTFIKKISKSKSQKHFVVLSLDNDITVEQEFSNDFFSKNKNLSHYIERYKSK